VDGIAVVAWRLGVSGCAATGVALAARQYDVWWTALSQLANLAVAVGFLVLAFAEPRSPWLRGALATAMGVVCLAYLPMANGNLVAPWSVLEHMVTPALVLVDFLLVGTNQADVRWWHPPTWLVPLAAYLAWYVGGDLAVYAALDPARIAEFSARLGALVALALAVGYLLYGGARVRRAETRLDT
jgi:hypothetical protein